MTALVPYGFLPSLTADLFGGNFLGHRDSVLPEDGFATLAEDLNITFLRFPGGSVTETYYSIADPDLESLINPATGEPVTITPFSDFMEFAADQGLPVTITLPTREALTDNRDSNGDRFAAIDAPLLRQFVTDAISGVFGAAPIAAFEIGNEYWGSGRMTAVEYGRVSSEMAHLLQNILDELADPSGPRPYVHVQMGTNFNFSSLDEHYTGPTEEILASLSEDYGLAFTQEVVRNSGEIDWTRVNNQLLLGAYETADETTAVDGVIVHLFSRDPALPGQRDFQLGVVQEMWVESGLFDDLSIYVSEWNQSGSSSGFDRSVDYGLYQAQEMLNILEAFSFWGVDRAAVWPLLQNTPNALAKGASYDGLTPAGEVFRRMSESLPGLSPIDFDPEDRIETEFQLGDLSIHGFYGDERLEIFVGSRAEGAVRTEIDLSPLIRAAGLPEAVRLGVLPGQAPGNNASTAVFTPIPHGDLLTGTTLNMSLSPGEILHVTFDDYVPTQGFHDSALAQGIETGRPLVLGTSGDDWIDFEDKRRVDGGDGVDTVVLPGNPGSYTLGFAGDTVRLQDRDGPAETYITLYDVERLVFSEVLPQIGSGHFSIDSFDGLSTLCLEDIAAITELYIAYFDRAPDALGLHFWANAFSEGMGLATMAEAFFGQPEHPSLYGEVTDIPSYITAVYENVLGRSPDPAGLSFWQGFLEANSPAHTPIFVQAILSGAKAASGSAEDAAYLSGKTTLGAYFAVSTGLSDLVAAQDVMRVYEETEGDLTQAIKAVDRAYADVMSNDESNFLIQTLGAIDWGEVF
ncbi:DUF4214 domain-containing protein [Marivita sp.]|uniref:DUF4214 domain-containing protein n=1 Tax=Marivita sp. TaxID=2003365 RepID=UPI003F6C6D98